MEYMEPLYIFELDRVLADIEHRMPILDDWDNPNRIQDFYAACINDKPVRPAIETFWRLCTHAECWIWTARPESVRNETAEWIRKYMDIDIDQMGDRFVMRREGDRRPPTELKRWWLAGMCPQDKKRLVAAFDALDEHVTILQKNGVTCFQIKNERRQKCIK